ncbi:hypothetical protein [Vibrio mediterranei]|uniref:hypothetical protein n=1 Tax=Vibrio mediterranei TaxID=689 RepID=UPI0040676AB7
MSQFESELNAFFRQREAESPNISARKILLNKGFTKEEIDEYFEKPGTLDPSTEQDINYALWERLDMPELHATHLVEIVGSYSLETIECWVFCFNDISDGFYSDHPILAELATPSSRGGIDGALISALHHCGIAIPHEIPPAIFDNYKANTEHRDEDVIANKDRYLEAQSQSEYVQIALNTLKYAQINIAYIWHMIMPHATRHSAGHPYDVTMALSDLFSDVMQKSALDYIYDNKGKHELWFDWEELEFSKEDHTLGLTKKLDIIFKWTIAENIPHPIDIRRYAQDSIEDIERVTFSHWNSRTQKTSSTLTTSSTIH